MYELKNKEYHNINLKKGKHPQHVLIQNVTI